MGCVTVKQTVAALKILDSGYIFKVQEGDNLFDKRYQDILYI